MACMQEYVEGGDLFQYCCDNGPLPEETARRCVRRFCLTDTARLLRLLKGLLFVSERL